eukprot:994833-Pleurochrysis_carterae.AAC.3
MACAQSGPPAASSRAATAAVSTATSVTRSAWCSKTVAIAHSGTTIANSGTTIAHNGTSIAATSDTSVATTDPNVVAFRHNAYTAGTVARALAVTARVRILRSNGAMAFASATIKSSPLTETAVCAAPAGSVTNLNAGAFLSHT